MRKEGYSGAENISPVDQPEKIPISIVVSQITTEADIIVGDVTESLGNDMYFFLTVFTLAVFTLLRSRKKTKIKK